MAHCHHKSYTSVGIDVPAFASFIYELPKSLLPTEKLHVQKFVNWSASEFVGTATTFDIQLIIVSARTSPDIATVLNAAGSSAFTSTGLAYKEIVNDLCDLLDTPSDTNQLPLGVFNTNSMAFDLPTYYDIGDAFTTVGTASDLTSFWNAVRNLSISVENLWTYFPNQMQEVATSVLQYRELATREANNYALETNGNLSIAPIVSLSTLDALVTSIEEGKTKSELMALYGGAALAYADQIKTLIEAPMLTTDQKRTVLVNFYTAMSQGSDFAGLLTTYSDLILQNPGDYLVYDKFAKSGIYPR